METKIEAVIYDTQLKLKKVEQDIMLLIREKDTLKGILDTLEIINRNKDLV